MAWGCFGGCKAPMLVFFDHHKVKAVNYIDLLKKTLRWPRSTLKRRRYRFMQDGAPPHSARITTVALEKMGIKKLLWPPSSCDLNPIEQMWGIVKAKIAGRVFANHSALQAAVAEEWSKIPQTTFDKAIASMPLRVKALVKARGGHFRL